MKGNGLDILLFCDLASVDDIGDDVGIQFLQLRRRGRVEILYVYLQVLQREVDGLVPLLLLVFAFLGQHEVEEA